MRKFSLSSASDSAGVVRDHGVVLRASGNRIWVRPPPPPPTRPPQPPATATSVSTFPPPTSAMVIRVQFVQWSYENHPYRACSYAAFTAEGQKQLLLWEVFWLGAVVRNAFMRYGVGHCWYFDYAQRRGINVLAELDIPGHVQSWTVESCLLVGAPTVRSRTSNS